MGANGQLLIGDKGKMLGSQLIPASKRKAYQEPQKTIPRSLGHYVEWIQACKGGKPAGSNFDWAGPLAETVLLGNIALRTGLREELTRTKLLWGRPQPGVHQPQGSQQVRTARVPGGLEDIIRLGIVSERLPPPSRFARIFPG